MSCHDVKVLKRGKRWFASPEEVPELEQFIHAHEATVAVSALTPLQTTLTWSAI
ncbi:hypothetical protein [Roseimicrobium sp. ORNL1]|uniref:hypothetical protein n=1 Tax=Roseimicrobium sp. ORNL1 TaxID=2711231 RepID=UPI0013E1E29C|nr:hypothetical protein [Roseimicrobium sp. ORNL1]QIF02073.1 hypothetical protein G5S37_11195 [Roseimicrobium sp. ORNL1]